MLIGNASNPQPWEQPHHRRSQAHVDDSEHFSGRRHGQRQPEDQTQDEGTHTKYPTLIAAQ